MHATEDMGTGEERAKPRQQQTEAREKGIAEQMCGEHEGVREHRGPRVQRTARWWWKGTWGKGKGKRRTLCLVDRPVVRRGREAGA